MKLKLPIFPLLGLIIVALTAVLSKTITDFPDLYENIGYILGIVLFLIGSLTESSRLKKNKQQKK